MASATRPAGRVVECDQIEAARIAQEDGGAKGLLLFVEDRPGQKLILLLKEQAEGFQAAIIIFFNGGQPGGVLAAKIAQSGVQVKILCIG